MKRVIRASEIPPGYLKTNKFNSRINDNNVLEAIEIAITQKYDQFERFCDRQLYLTSGSSWSGVVMEYPEGYWVRLEATRSSFDAFVQGDSVIRKPRKLSHYIGEYEVSGDRGHVEYVSRNRVRRIREQKQ